MRAKLITLFCLTFVLVSFWKGVEQANAQVSIQSATVTQNLQVFFLSGLDVNSGANLPEFFVINMMNSGTSTHQVQLRLSILKDGELLYRDAVTKRFPINPGTLRLTNRQLFSSGIYGLEESGTISDAGEDLVQDILSRGKLPTGRYTVRVQLRDFDDPSVDDQGEDSVLITNPGKLDLISPGSSAGRLDDCQEIYVTLPQFHWESDFSAFQVIIAEAKPGEDPESSLNQEPRFVEEFYVNPDIGEFFVIPEGVIENVFEGRRPEPLALTSLQYPSSGQSLVFRPGKTYYWRVIAFASSTSGSIPFESEVFCFRIAQFDQVGGGLEQYEFILRNFLGADYDDIFGEGGQLQNYRPQRMTLNGKEVTLPDILQDMSKLSEKYSGYRIVN